MNLLKKMLVVVLCATMVFSIIPFGNVEAEAASPTVTVNTGSEYYSIGETNAVLCGKVSNPNKAKVSKLGIKLYDSSEKLLKDHSESSTFTVTEVVMWFDVNSEIGYTLKKGTTYKYRMYAVVGGTTYTSSMASFTTADPDKAQNAIMPLKKIYVTQKAGGSYSHAGTKNVDFGKSQNLYAPFDCKVVYKDTSYDGGNSIVIESTSKVRFADGTYDYMTVLTAHDNDISDLSKGKTIKQGSVYYHTGTYGNVTGEHVHMCVAKGKYAGQYENSNGNWELKNSILPSKAFFIDASTTIVDSGGYTWKSLPILSVYYNANGGSISSDTYYLSSNNIYKTSDNSKVIQKWTYNEAKENGLYDDTTFGIYRTGYTFLGWSTSSSGGTVYDKKDNTILPTDLNSNIKNGNCSVTMYAVWEEEAAAYTLTYDSNEGSITPSPVTSDSNGTVVLSDVIPERFGYSFVGWNETGDIDDGFYVPGQEIVIYEDTTLYAVWDEFECEASSANDILLSAPANVVYIKFVPEVTTAYCFKTYSTEDNLDTIGALYNVNGTELVSDDDSGDGNNFMFYYTLYAGEIYYIKVTSFNSVEGRFGFEIIPDYIITYDANGGEIILDNSSLQQISDVAKFVPSIEIIRDGYTFIGWSEDSNTAYAEYTEGDELNVNGNITLYAVWQKNGIASGDEGDDNSTLSIDILTPSTTKISYKDGIVLHTAITGEIPEGATVVWEASNNNFEMHTLVMNACGIISKANGNTVITVKIVNENGEILAQDSQYMTSNAGFFQKIIVFFKEIFGILPKVIPQAFKASF